MAKEYRLLPGLRFDGPSVEEKRKRLQEMIPARPIPENYLGPLFDIATGKRIDEEVPKWVADEIKATWKAMRSCDGQLEAYRICERMVDRLGYGRRDDNPSLV